VKTGRPSLYTPEVTEVILGRLAAGESLRTICESDDLPDQRTVFNWLAKYPDFATQYTRAKELAAEAIAEEIFDISDDGRNDWMEIQSSDGGNVGWRVNGEAVQRSKLRVETRKWYLAKILPKKYGDKVQQELSSPDGSAPTLNVVIRSVLDKPENIARRQIEQPSASKSIINLLPAIDDGPVN